MNTLKTWKPKVYDYIEGTVSYLKYSTFKKGVAKFTKVLTYLLTYLLIFTPLFLQEQEFHKSLKPQRSFFS